MKSDMDRRCMQFYHALHKRNHVRIKNLVLNEGISVNHMFVDGSFPIHVAAEKGDIHNLEFLLSLRASPDLKNRHGQTALMLGIEYPDIVKLLIEFNCGVNLMDSQQRTALHLAGSRGLIKVVTMMLASGARVNVQDRWGRTPLHITLLNVSHRYNYSRDFMKVVQVLLSHKADPNCIDRQRATPLFLGINGGILDIIEHLISAGARVNQPSRHNLTPLMVAVIKKFEHICKYLLSQNCDLEKRENGTDTSALKLAAQRGHLSIVQLLVAAGTKVHQEAWLYKLDTVCKAANKTEEVATWLEGVAVVPPSLTLMCRTCIRQALGFNPKKKVPTLQYPQTLKNYILMTELLHSK